MSLAETDTHEETVRTAHETQPGPNQMNSGLSEAEAARRLQQYGYNRLPEPSPPGFVLTFLRQFLSPFIYILLVAAVVSFLINQVPSGVFIIAVLLINAIIGAIQEYSAQRSAAALRAMVKGTAHVVRDGSARKIDAELVVPGDLILVSSGDRIPADIALIDSDDLSIDESMLTGESLAVLKNAKAHPKPDAPLAERTNYLFAGSVVTRGRGRGLVTHTALESEI